MQILQSDWLSYHSVSVIGVQSSTKWRPFFLFFQIFEKHFDANGELNFREDLKKRGIDERMRTTVILAFSAITP